MTKTIGFISDTHCGAKTGLSTRPSNNIQRKLLGLYKETVEWMGRVDYLVHLGDIIDGDDIKSKDLSEHDLPEQIQDGCALLEMIDAGEYFLLAGTPYHVSQSAQMWDKMVVNLLNKGGRKASYHQKLKLKVDWFYCQCRHKIGSSGIAHGRYTAPARSKAWDATNAAIKSSRTGKAAKLANLLVFGHVHYWTYAEDAIGTAVTLPCWQALGSLYGDMCCDGHVDLGAFKVTIGERGDWSWEKKLYLPSLESRTVKR